MRPLMTAVLASVALGCAACGGSDEQETPAGAQAPAATETATPEPGGTGVGPLAAAIGEDLGEKPQIPAPQGEPPGRLVTRDIVKGTGPAAKAGDEVTVQYVGASWSTGQEFDASWDGGQPFPFQLGAQQVIAGWDEGVAGMRRGGRRLLVIPPEMGYGADGYPPAIARNETLVFVVDLLEIS